MARKYQFKDRAEAEQQYRKADRERLMVGWLLTAILDGRNVEIGTTDEFTVGYVTLLHSSIIYAIRNTTGSGKGSLHRLAGIWDAGDDELRNVIVAHFRSEDESSRNFGYLLDQSNIAALKAA